MIRRAGDTVCDPHRTCGGDEKHEFPSLGLKIDGGGLVIWVSKSSRRFLVLGLQTKRRRFVNLRLKIDEQIKTV
jgi:hypothetical protein